MGDDMTHEELISAINQLPLEQRTQLLEAVSRSVQEEMRSHQDKVSAVERLRGIAKPDGPLPTDRQTESAGQGKAPISQRLYGILEFDGNPPTDDEVKDARADYLLEKYS